VADRVTKKIDEMEFESRSNMIREYQLPSNLQDVDSMFIQIWLEQMPYDLLRYFILFSDKSTTNVIYHHISKRAVELLKDDIEWLKLKKDEINQQKVLNQTSAVWFKCVSIFLDHV
jgi:flagellar motor switch protein FliG